MSDTDCTSEISQLEVLSLSDESKIFKKVNLQVEALLKKKVPKSVAVKRINEVGKLVTEIREKCLNWKPARIESNSDETVDYSDENVPIEHLFEKLLIGSCQLSDGVKIQCTDQFIASTSNVHFYKLNSDGPLSQNIGEDDDNIIGSQVWQIPCVEFENIWENLIYDSNLKNDVLSYVHALVHLSEKHVNSKIINVNRLILLTGPPGTGKTSLCKGLAQHLSISFNDRYPHSVLIEINSHSLFSKWFSESGKLVQRMFDQIDEYAEDSKCMVFVLIDEVESLGMCRESSRSEPADAIRAVNALLTQIDRVRRRDNVLILCTSNLESSLDRALIDRADIVKNVGEPSTLALYAMLKSCIMEMIRIGVVDGDSESFQDILAYQSESLNSETLELFKIAKDAHGLSGRAISMLPTLVYSKSLEEIISLPNCLHLFRKAVKERKMRNN